MFRNAVSVSGKTSLGPTLRFFRTVRMRKKLKLMVDLGMAPIEALKFLTAIDAELFGLVQKWDSRKRQAGRYHCDARRSDRGHQRGETRRVRDARGQGVQER